MLVLLLPLALAFPPQSVQVRVGGDKPRTAQDSAAVVIADSVARRERRRDRTPRHIAVTPELEASAFRDPGARVLLLKARAARLRQDSALLSYDATTYQRLSAGMGIRAIGRERLLFRTENATRVRWSRDGGAYVDVKGARTAFPMLKDGEGDVDMHEMSPIPYYPGREALWIGEGVAKAEVDDRELVHPIATGAEAYYRYASGDSLRFKLSDGKEILLKEIRVEPRRPEWRLSVGSFWFDESSGQLVRAAYRLAVPMDIWQVAKEENLADSSHDKDDDPPRWVMAMVSPLSANLEAVTIEYGLYGGRFWLPRVQSASGSAQASFMRFPFRMEESFKYASVNGLDSLPKLPPPPKSIRDSLFGHDSTRWRDLTPEQRRDRAKQMATADSVRREQRKVGRKAQCDSVGTWTRMDSRYDGAVRVAVSMPCDTTLLAKAPELPPSIYEPGEELFGASERDELLKSLDFSLQAGWAPQRPVFRYGLSMTRYNRVEGLSLGLSVKEELGRGYTAELIPRFSQADRQPNGELFLRRSNGRRQLQVGLYRRLDAANDWGSPLSFGSSLSAFLYGRDEGFYSRSWGGELTGSNVAGGGLTWRLFGERQDEARRATSFSLASAWGDTKFIENIAADEGMIVGGSARLTKTFGFDPMGWRLFSDARAEAGTGMLDYTRAALDLTVSHAIASRFAASLTGSAGTSGGTLPVQRLWYLGDAQTVRGQQASPTDSGHVGNSFWMGRLELGGSFAAARPVIFGDLGWAGDRNGWAHPGRPMSGVGAGVSFLDGLFRFDVSRGLYPSKKTRVDFYLEAKF